ncbi:dual specificity tyrosine-phosphorylation-regulated kinase 1A-like isoform X2 [Paralichthys olivaceus]|uniref:dual specificity tyrosine-phosphorylation-regulated kinase 1A-like isoform X2 n=1 Tax=Paralichthys olivaceus TaxID=8255 RepID=UPI0037516DF8
MCRGPHLKAAGIVHADLKLDNVMLVNQLREPFRVKVIDFGLAREPSDAKLKAYIQTLSYRSPEILLGHPFTEAIDMWSLGCMAAAMYLGTLLYPGLGEYEMIKFITSTQGQLPQAMMNRGHKTPKFFKYEVSFTNSFWKLKTPELYHKETGKQPVENRSLKFTSLDHIVDVRPINTCNPANRAAEMSDVHMFVDMLKAMLQLDPKTRITPHQLLEHKFISMRHIASMDQQSNYVRSSFQMMELCQKNIQTSASSKAVCGPLMPPRPSATSHAEWRKNYQPHHNSLLSCTTTQSSGIELQRKRKINHDDVLPPKKICLDRSNAESSTSRKYSDTHQSDQRARPADHHHHHNAGPSGRTRTEGQVQSEKRKRGDHDDGPPQKKIYPPRSLNDGSRSRHCERKRDSADCAGRSTCSDDSSHSHQIQSDQRARPADHHHHNAGPSGRTRTEGQVQSGQKKRKRGDHDDGPPQKKIYPPRSPNDGSRSRHCERKRDSNDCAGRSTCSEDSSHSHQIQSDQRARPADHHHNAGPSGRTRTEGQVQSGQKKRKRGDHDDGPPQKKIYPPRSPNDGSRSRHCERKRDSNDCAGRSTCSDDSSHSHQIQSDQRARPADHHHNAGTSDGTRTEGQAGSGRKRKRGDHDDGPPQKK